MHPFSSDAPLAPEGPLEVSDIHKDGCKLKWKKPKDDGGIPLQGYEVEKMDPDTGTWLPVGKTKEPGNPLQPKYIRKTIFIIITFIIISFYYCCYYLVSGFLKFALISCRNIFRNK